LEQIRVLEDNGLARIFMSKTRGKILKELAIKPRSISQLARTIGISPPAVYYHIKILEEAKMIAVTRVEKVRNNLVEKFYSPTSPGFLIVGSGQSMKGPVPGRKKSQKETWNINLEGMEELLSDFGLTIHEGCESELEGRMIDLLKIISLHAQNLGREVFNQLDDGISKAELRKFESLAASLVPLAVIYAFDDPKFIESLHSLKNMIEVR
jgi:DNA-binding transcriptional ArsR family regulator